MKNSQKGFIGLPVVVVVLIGLIVVGTGAYFVIHQKSTSTITSENNLPTLPVSSRLPSANTVAPNSNTIQCGSVNQNILTQYDYKPTETEKEAVVKSLTCINQAIIKCSPASLAIGNVNKITNITVKGEGKLGCNISVQKYTGEIMTCPLPSDYVVTLKNKFVASNYDATIVTDLVTNINAEISAGNKSGNCTVTK